MARRLERLQAEQVGQKMANAAGRMGQSGAAGEQGDGAQAGQKADEAGKDLDDAQEQLAKRRRQAEADLAQEQVARIEDSIKSLYDRQGQVMSETARLEKQRAAKGQLSRGESASVQELSRQQRSLETETRQLAEKVAAAEVFHLALSAAAREMLSAADLLARRDTGSPTQQAEDAAQRRLARLIVALQSDRKKEGEQEQAGQGNSGGSGQGGQGGIRSIAELKLLKLMQEDLNERFSSAAAPDSGTPEERAALLSRLSQEQGQLAELTLKLSQPTESNPEDNPDKLPDIRPGRMDTEKEKPQPDGGPPAKGRSADEPGSPLDE